jgi:hypothetical protein
MKFENIVYQIVKLSLFQSSNIIIFYVINLVFIYLLMFGKLSKFYHNNLSKPITGIKKFDDYFSIAHLNGQIKTYHRDGSLKSIMKTKGFENKEMKIDNRIKFLDLMMDILI